MLFALVNHLYYYKRILRTKILTFLTKFVFFINRIIFLLRLTKNKNNTIITLKDEVKTLIKLYLADISVLCDPLNDNGKISLLPQERQIKILRYKLATIANARSEQV